MPFLIICLYALLVNLAKAEMTVSYAVFDIESKSLIKAQNENKQMILASTTKLITTYFALNKLGADHRFQTIVYSRGTVEKGILNGDLILVGGGDPYLTAQDLTSLIMQIKNSGIKKINGEFLVDGNYFPNKKQIAPIGLEDQTDNPSISGLNVEFNRFTLWRRGKEMIPPLAHLKIETSNKSSQGLKFDYHDSGKWIQHNGEDIKFIEQLPAKNSAKFAGEYFRFLANRLQLELPEAKVLAKSYPKTQATKIAIHESLPLYRLVSLGLEYSNNIIAESLLYEACDGASATDQCISNWLRENYDFLKNSKFNLENGSGLTTNNLLNANEFAKLLIEFYQKPPSPPRAFISYLSINSHSGAINKRLRSQELSFRVYAKTGSLYYVNNLAGYFIGKSGKIYSFVVLMTDEEKRKILNAGNSKKANQLRQDHTKWSQEAYAQQDQLLQKWMIKY